MGYPLWAQFVAEACAMATAITLGEGIIANEVLKRTKGHELGLGFVSIGFGMAFFVAIEMYGGISASCNPAMFLAKGMAGKKTWTQVAVGMAADFLGAFVGAIFVWLLYLGHFSLVPEPPKPAQIDGDDAKKAAQYGHLLDPLSTVPDHKRNSFISYTGRDQAGRQMSLLYQGGDDLRKRGPRATMQVADVLHQHDSESAPGMGTPSSLTRTMSSGGTFTGALQLTSQGKDTRESTTDLLEGKEDIEYAAYEAALIQDQNAKLSVFATRPAVLNFPCNWLCEFVGTFFLIYCALMIEERPFILPEEFEPIWKAIAEPFFVGWMVVACVMSMAGPTGYAANPARDMGPRIAHFLLPIPNKGPSEFWYSWVPFTASFAGGALGGIAFWASKELYHSGAAYQEWAMAGATKGLASG